MSNRNNVFDSVAFPKFSKCLYITTMQTVSLPSYSTNKHKPIIIILYDSIIYAAPSSIGQSIFHTLFQQSRAKKLLLFIHRPETYWAESQEVYSILYFIFLKSTMIEVQNDKNKLLVNVTSRCFPKIIFLNEFPECFFFS